MQPLLLQKQTLDVGYDPGALLLDGPNVRFTKAEQMLSKTGGPGRQFSVGVQLQGAAAITTTYSSGSTGQGFRIESMRVRDRDREITYRLNMSQAQLVAVIPDTMRQVYQIMTHREESHGEASFRMALARDRCFLTVHADANGGLRLNIGTPADVLPAIIRDIIHVPATRGRPQRQYPATAATSPFSGTFDSYVASVLAQWEADHDAKLPLAGRNLETLGLTWKVQARRVSEVELELRVGRLPHALRGGAHDLVNIADVGFGVSQCLAVVVGLLAAQPGQLIYLEEPEIHLHPRAQFDLAPLLCEAAARGVRVVVETHSSLLLRGIQVAIAHKKLAPSAVKLHWFSRSEQDGTTVVSSANMDSQGAFGDWPVDFDEVVLHAETAYLNAPA